MEPTERNRIMETIEARTHQKSAQASAGNRGAATKLHVDKQVVRTLTGQELGVVAGGQGQSIRPPQTFR
jgi:hypothetical protein